MESKLYIVTRALTCHAINTTKSHTEALGRPEILRDRLTMSLEFFIPQEKIATCYGQNHVMCISTDQSSCLIELSPASTLTL